ncbi:hypothetical protein [Robinsoniella peoriensis]|uniref:hypothetical protein n=1 Tax=Robinsoniella peoriensis TaxID=180332 RepID=UPI0010FAD46F|nr:hypothetical protein [Robinsoniella peoriensis]MDU7026914.1 hypothetical protein [Clostridiales bacterium]
MNGVNDLLYDRSLKFGIGIEMCGKTEQCFFVGDFFQPVVGATYNGIPNHYPELDFFPRYF